MTEPVHKEPRRTVYMRCPICHHLNLVYPDEPVSRTPSNYMNRCSGHTLSGAPARGGIRCAKNEYSWCGLQTMAGKLCGFPLLHVDSRPVLPLPTQEMMEITRRDFDVKEYQDLVTKRSLETYRNLDTRASELPPDH